MLGSIDREFMLLPCVGPVHPVKHMCASEPATVGFWQTTTPSIFSHANIHLRHDDKDDDDDGYLNDKAMKVKTREGSMRDMGKECKSER